MTLRTSVRTCDNSRAENGQYRHNHQNKKNINKLYFSFLILPSITTIGVARIFNGGEGNRKSHAITLSDYFEKREFFTEQKYSRIED